MNIGDLKRVSRIVSDNTIYALNMAKEIPKYIWYDAKKDSYTGCVNFVIMGLVFVQCPITWFILYAVFTLASMTFCGGIDSVLSGNMYSYKAI